MADDPIIASDNLETAIVPHGEEQNREDDESESESSDEEQEREYPAGPADPERCTIGGPGANGGSAQLPVSFHIQTRDSSDKKLTAGGDYVVVKVVPGTTAKAGGAKETEAIVKDNNDGSYTATYSAESRGDYELVVEINGSAFGGSPFPVFFSPPDEEALARAQNQSLLLDAKGNSVDTSLSNAAKDNLDMPTLSILGKDAYKARVEFPEDQDLLERTMLVGNMNPAVTIEQLKKLFSYSGVVSGCQFTGEKNAFALVEFGTAEEAESALTLDNLLVIDRQIRVESAKIAFESKGQSSGTQFAALQLQQIQQLQKSQSEQHSLVATVASMRVQQKSNPNAFVPGLPQNSASQKAAALSAIAALSKKLTGSSHGAPAVEPGTTKRRRDISPTLRYRKDRRSASPRRFSPPRRRSRSRRRSRTPPRRRSPPPRYYSPPRRRRSVERYRSPPRRRTPERRRSRDIERDRRVRERVRERSLEERRSRREERRSSSDRRRRRSRSPTDEKRRREDSRRERSRDRDRRRSHDSKSLERAARSKEAKEPAEKGDVEMEERHDSETVQDIDMPDANPKEGSWQSVEAVAQPANGQSSEDKAEEASQLRQKALQALKSIDWAKDHDGDVNDAEEQPADPADAKKERRKSHKKDKHHKKDKKKRREHLSEAEEEAAHLDEPDFEP